MSIMSPQDEQWKRLYISTSLCSQNINKQIVNIADENLTDYSFLSRYHYTKSKHYLKRRYWIRHRIPRFIGTPCIIKLFARIYICKILPVKRPWTELGNRQIKLSDQNRTVWIRISTDIFTFIRVCYSPAISASYWVQGENLYINLACLFVCLQNYLFLLRRRTPMLFINKKNPHVIY